MHWPVDQRFLDDDRLASLAARCRDAYVAACNDMRIDNDLEPLLERLYLPLAAWLLEARGESDSMQVVGVCGAQGSGKSTFCRLLSTVMAEALGHPTATLSIDDIYETRERREALAREVHPLFATRGVPGTHDVELGLEIINGLAGLAEGEELRIPVFDKAIDTRLSREHWKRQCGPVQTLFFEGWCVGARAQSEEELVEPVNSLERDEDTDAVWRRTVNNRLEGNYQTLFALIDVLIMLRVDGMHRVFTWRRLQEHKLAESTEDTAGVPSRIMTDAEVDRFVMHYERLTRHILAEMPSRADIVLNLDASHSASSVIINKPLGRPV